MIELFEAFLRQTGRRCSRTAGHLEQAGQSRSTYFVVVDSNGKDQRIWSLESFQVEHRTAGSDCCKTVEVEN